MFMTFKIMKATQQFAVSVAGILLVGGINQARADVVTSFTGNFDPGNWSSTESDGATPPPAATFSPIGAATTLMITAAGNNFTPGANPPPQVYFFAEAIIPSSTVDYTLSFAWSISKGLDSAEPQARYFVSDPSLDVLETGTVSSAGAASATVDNLDIPAGDTLTFVFQGGGTEANKDFGANLDITIIPEAASWQAGVFLLGILGVTAIRQTQVRSEKKSL